MVQLLKALILINFMLLPLAKAADLPTTVKKIKPAIVAVAIEDPIGSPRYRLIGSGFVISKGGLIITNAHVIEKKLPGNQRYVVISGSAEQIKVHQISRQQTFVNFDLAIISIPDRLSGLELLPAGPLDDGTDLAFTGYPITDVLGLFPATHRATLSAVTPIVIPQSNSQTLSAEMVRLLRKPIVIYQLDATAYPGNSGSPLYEPASGRVAGIINMVYIKRNKEAVLADPSGISYAIPVQYLHLALEQFKNYD